MEPSEMAGTSADKKADDMFRCSAAITMGWLGSLSMIAQQWCGIFGGTYVDRHDCRTLIIVNAAVGFLSWGAVALLSAQGFLSAAARHRRGLIGGQRFLGSAADAMLKSIVDIRDNPKARSLNKGRDSAINMAGRLVAESSTASTRGCPSWRHRWCMPVRVFPHHFGPYVQAASEERGMRFRVSSLIRDNVHMS